MLLNRSIFLDKEPTDKEAEKAGEKKEEEKKESGTEKKEEKKSDHRRHSGGEGSDFIMFSCNPTG